MEEEEKTNKERKILRHEIVYGTWSFKTKSGDNIRIMVHCHSLLSFIKIWDEENDEWYEEETDDIDDFNLTDSDKGYKFDRNDIYNFFDIEEGEPLDWETSGFDDNLCGIEETDDINTSEKKWNTYKDKFPLVSSKSQFVIKEKNNNQHSQTGKEAIEQFIKQRELEELNLYDILKGNKELKLSSEEIKKREDQLKNLSLEERKEKIRKWFNIKL